MSPATSRVRSARILSKASTFSKGAAPVFPCLTGKTGALEIAHARVFPSPHPSDDPDFCRADVRDFRRDPSGARRSGRDAHGRAWHYARTPRHVAPPARARPAGMAAIPRLCLAIAAWRFRHVAIDPAERADRIPHLISRHARTDVLRFPVRADDRPADGR